MIVPELFPYVSAERLIDEAKGFDNVNIDRIMVEIAKRVIVHQRRVDSEQVYALLAAGWSLEWPDQNLEPMSWSWRRPPKGTRETGRIFHSTGQAFSALQKEEA